MVVLSGPKLSILLCLVVVTRSVHLREGVHLLAVVILGVPGSLDCLILSVGQVVRIEAVVTAQSLTLSAICQGHSVGFGKC